MNPYEFFYEFLPLLSFLFSIFLIVLVLKSGGGRRERRTTYVTSS